MRFSDDELIEVISKSDEWNKFDISLAKKLLKEKGKEITPEEIEEIEEIKRQRILELSKPEKDQKIYIISRIFSCIFGRIFGVFYWVAFVNF